MTVTAATTVTAAAAAAAVTVILAAATATIVLMKVTTMMAAVKGRGEQGIIFIIKKKKRRKITALKERCHFDKFGIIHIPLHGDHFWLAGRTKLLPLCDNTLHDGCARSGLQE